jgi:hypothetical protein
MRMDDLLRPNIDVGAVHLAAINEHTDLVRTPKLSLGEYDDDMAAPRLLRSAFSPSYKQNIGSEKFRNVQKGMNELSKVDDDETRIHLQNCLKIQNRRKRTCSKQHDLTHVAVPLRQLQESRSPLSIGKYVMVGHAAVPWYHDGYQQER